MREWPHLPPSPPILYPRARSPANGLAYNKLHSLYLLYHRSPAVSKSLAHQSFHQFIHSSLASSPSQRTHPSHSLAMKPLLLLTLGTLAATAADDCASGSQLVKGNYYCQPVQRIAYKNVGGAAGTYQRVTSMDSASGTCGFATQGYSGPLAPLDEDVGPPALSCQRG